MNYTLKSFTVLALIAISFASCQSHVKDQIIGKWRIAKVEFYQFKQQQQFDQKQIAMMQDSISKNTDTAKIARFQKILKNTQMRADQMQAQQDTMIKKSRWDFKSNGDFEATEIGGPNKGIWSYDEEKGILFTVINHNAYSQNVKFNKDTMILQLDSLNYMGFVKASD